MINKTLYIHIGTPKTGSTALQHFFSRNADTLEMQGLYYPRYRQHPDVKNHLYFSNLVTKQGRHKGDANPGKTAKRRVEGYLRKVADKSGACHSILLSGEEMFYARDLAMLGGVPAMFTTVKIVAYLRRQDRFVQSYYLQDFKKGKIREPLASHAYVKDDFWLDYYARIELWSAKFGQENMIVRPFEKVQFPDGDLFADFIVNVLHLDYSDAYTTPTPEESNPSIHQDVYEAIKVINSLDLPRKRIRFILKKLHEFPVPAENRLKDHSLLTLEECVRILERHESNNKKIALEYLDRSDGELFYAPYPDQDTHKVFSSGSSGEKIGRVLLWLIIALQNEMDWRWKLKHLLQRATGKRDNPKAQRMN